MFCMSNASQSIPIYKLGLVHLDILNLCCYHETQQGECSERGKFGLNFLFGF